MTPIGTGAGLLKIEVFMKALANDAVEYIYRKSEKLREIVVVVDDEEKFTILKNKFLEKKK